MSEVLRILILIMGSVFVVCVFYLLMMKKINERASLPWIATALVIIILALIPSLLKVLASLLHIDYPPALLFLISNFVLFLLLLYQSIQISALQDKCKELAQNLSIMNSTGTTITDRTQEKAKVMISQNFQYRKEKKMNIPL